MKKIYNYIMLFIMAFAVASCADDELVANKVLGQTGDEVQFGLSLQSSRTVYGDGTKDNNGQVVSYPIYWVDGDKVLVFSPQCLNGRNGAEYKVILPTNGDKAYYAENLEKTGAYGVQWGEADKAIFYSIYPSGAYGMNEDYTLATGLLVNYSQNIIVDGENIKSDMEDCLLYARADGGEANDYEGVTKGETVNLQYNPITTVFRLKLNVPSTSLVDFTIQSISIIAPDGTDIAGKFSINVEDASFAAWGDSKARTVSAAISDKNTGGFYTLTKGNSLEIPMFLAPVPNLNTDGWKIEVKANNNTYTKTLGSQDVAAGKIHHITLPNLTLEAEEETEWEVSNWMKNIPRNVYLSEISIPGTWNSLNADCQSDQSISSQYAKGVRAFHIDTRWKRTGYSWIIGNNYEYSLGTADGGGSTNTSGGRFMTDSDNPTFETSLNAIVSQVQSDEYMVLFCTFAHDSNNHVENGNYWYDEISRICGENESVYDASTLTKNTVVGDVLGHVIVVVNLASSVSSTTLPENSKCLFTYVPMLLPENHYAETTSHIDGLHYSTGVESGISMYTSHAQISTTNTSAVNCGDRGYSHPLTDRDNLVKSFWDWSKSNYGTTNYNHDKWIYLGLGGYIMTSSNSSGSGYDTVENRYAPMVYDRIDEMGKNNVPFYPVGIILMNNKKGSNYTDSNGTNLNYGFSDVCKQILLLNNKYRLQYDPTKPEDYKPNDSLGGEGGDGF